jgi:hypothetical protein
MSKYSNLISDFEESFPKRKNDSKSEGSNKKAKVVTEFEGDWKKLLSENESTTRKVTLPQIKMKLTSMGIPFSSKSKKDELWELLKMKILEDD